MLLLRAAPTHTCCCACTLLVPPQAANCRTARPQRGNGLFVARQCPATDPQSATPLRWEAACGAPTSCSLVCQSAAACPASHSIACGVARIVRYGADAALLPPFQAHWWEICRMLAAMQCRRCGRRLVAAGPQVEAAAGPALVCRWQALPALPPYRHLLQRWLSDFNAQHVRLPTVWVW